MSVDPRIILHHYGQQYARNASPSELSARLESLTQGHNIAREEVLAIYEAHKSGWPLMPRNLSLLSAPAFNQAKRVKNLKCTVCLEWLKAADFPSRSITVACDHPNENVCLPCLSQSIATQFDNRIWDHIDCPHCGERLAFEDVKVFADADTFHR